MVDITKPVVVDTENLKEKCKEMETVNSIVLCYKNVAFNLSWYSTFILHLPSGVDGVVVTPVVDLLVVVLI